jgi:septal ring factor EnvC (AmiA/AmiB activator)
MTGSIPWVRATAAGVLAIGLVSSGVVVAQVASSAPPATPSSSSSDLSAVSTEANLAVPGVPSWIHPKLDDPQDALSQLEDSVSLSKDRVAKMQADIAAMKGDREKQNAALIAAGERVKTAEADIAGVQNKIGDLIVQELDTRGRLDGADASISNVLAALERISRDPPPALVVDPSDALGSARSAMLISAILPQLKTRADQVISDLDHLAGIKAAAQGEENKLKANFDVLEEEQLRIATLIAAKKQNEAVANITLAEEQREAQATADKAGALKTLVATLAQRAKALAVAADATAEANSGGKAPKLPPETVKLALANPERQEPAVPFQSAKGFLEFPAQGINVINYGDGDGFGGISNGLSVVTRAGASVLAPADGSVLFAGDYLNYGQIVILDAGQDYSILLAGLDKVAVQPGQFVKMGEAVGMMGSRTAGRTVATSAGVANPTLYIELRNKNSPMDPTGWWASQNPTQSG